MMTMLLYSIIIKIISKELEPPHNKVKGNGLISCDAQPTVADIIEAVHSLKLTIMLFSICCLFYGYNSIPTIFQFIFVLPDVLVFRPVITLTYLGWDTLYRDS